MHETRATFKIYIKYLRFFLLWKNELKTSSALSYPWYVSFTLSFNFFSSTSPFYSACFWKQMPGWAVKIFFSSFWVIYSEHGACLNGLQRQDEKLNSQKIILWDPRYGPWHLESVSQVIAIYVTQLSCQLNHWASGLSSSLSLARYGVGTLSRRWALMRAKWCSREE